MLSQTDGWQQSNECQDETGMIYFRRKHEGVTMIPVKCQTFSDAYDLESQQRWLSMKLATVQQIFVASDEDWMNSVLRGVENALGKPSLTTNIPRTLSKVNG